MDFGIPDLPVIDISSTWDEPGKVVKSARSFKKSKALNLKTNNKLKNNKVITPPSINGRSAIIITEGGFIKRLSMEEFKTQSRGGKGKTAVRLPGVENSVTHFFSCNDYDSLIITTDKGYAYSCKAYQIPVCSRISKGKAVHQVVPIPLDASITSVIPIDSFAADDEQLVLLTHHGYIKRTALKAFEHMTGHGLMIISLESGDYLRWVRRCMPQDEVIIATRDGYASRMVSTEINSTSRKSRGVRALSLRNGDELTDIAVLRLSYAENQALPSQWYLLVVTGMGYGKRISVNDIHSTKRGCKGVMLTKFKAKAVKKPQSSSSTDTDDNEMNDWLSCIRCCEPGDEVMLVTGRGTIMRQRIDDISIQSRSASGVLLQSSAKGDPIKLIDIVAPSSDLDAVPMDFSMDAILNGDDTSIDLPDL